MNVGIAGSARIQPLPANITSCITYEHAYITASAVGRGAGPMTKHEYADARNKVASARGDWRTPLAGPRTIDHGTADHDGPRTTGTTATGHAPVRSRTRRRRTLTISRTRMTVYIGDGSGQIGCCLERPADAPPQHEGLVWPFVSPLRPPSSHRT